MLSGREILEILSQFLTVNTERRTHVPAPLRSEVEPFYCLSLIWKRARRSIPGKRGLFLDSQSDNETTFPIKKKIKICMVTQPFV